MKTELCDFHSHGCWNIDDGVKDESEALIFLTTAVDSGITKLFCTPHMIPNGKYDNSVEQVVVAVERLKELALRHKLPISIYKGSEFYLTESSLDRFMAGNYVTLESTNILLVEYAKNVSNIREINDRIFEISNSGIQIMIAHPERYFSNENEMMECVNDWLASGYYLQINRSSLLGMHSDLITSLSWKLLKEGCVHIISSDAHTGVGNRICRLDDVAERVKQKIGITNTEILFIENPRRLINREPLLRTKRIPPTLIEIIRKRIFRSTEY